MSELGERVARLEAQVEAVKEATVLAKDEVDGWRGKFIDTDRYEERHHELLGRLGEVERALSAIQGGTQVKTATIGWVIAGAGLFITFVVVITNILTA
jgi:hypothetical protein